MHLMMVSDMDTSFDKIEKKGSKGKLTQTSGSNHSPLCCYILYRMLTCMRNYYLLELHELNLMLNMLVCLNMLY